MQQLQSILADLDAAGGFTTPPPGATVDLADVYRSAFPTCVVRVKGDGFEGMNIIDGDWVTVEVRDATWGDRVVAQSLGRSFLATVLTGKVLELADGTRIPMRECRVVGVVMGIVRRL